MVRHTLAGVAFVALGLARGPGCGGVDAPSGRANAPCTRSTDCTTGLVCSEGVCREPDAGAPIHDAGDPAEDGAAPAGDAGDDGG